MALAVSSVSDSGGKGTTSSFSFNHQVHVAESLLLVCIATQSGTVLTCTFNGQSLTLLEKAENVGGEADGCEMWYMFNPPIGTYAVAVTLSGAYRTGGGAICITGADGLTPIDVKNVSEVAVGAPSCSVTTNVPNTILVDCLYHTQTTPNPTQGSGQVRFVNHNPTSSDYFGASYKVHSAIGLGTMTWTRSGEHSMIVVAVQEAQYGGGFLLNFV